MMSTQGSIILFFLLRDMFEIFHITFFKIYKIFLVYFLGFIIIIKF